MLKWELNANFGNNFDMIFHWDIGMPNLFSRMGITLIVLIKKITKEYLAGMITGGISMGL